MASEKDKRDSKSRSRRHSSEVVLHSSRRSRKRKDGDTESEASTHSSSDTVVVVPPPDKKCPLRFILTMLDADTEDKRTGCPLRRVQLWHTIPLCLLAVINLLLVIIALLGLASYRIVTGSKDFIFGLAKSNLDSYDGGIVTADDATVVSSEKP